MGLELVGLPGTIQAARSQKEAQAASKCLWWVRWGSPPATSASPTPRWREGWRPASPTRSAPTMTPSPTSPPPGRASCLSPRTAGTCPPPTPSTPFPFKSLPALHWCPDSLYKDNQNDHFAQFSTLTANKQLYKRHTIPTMSWGSLTLEESERRILNDHRCVLNIWYVLTYIHVLFRSVVFHVNVRCPFKHAELLNPLQNNDEYTVRCYMSYTCLWNELKLEISIFGGLVVKFRFI